MNYPRLYIHSSALLCGSRWVVDSTSQVAYNLETLRKEGVDSSLTFWNVPSYHEFPVNPHIVDRRKLSQLVNSEHSLLIEATPGKYTFIL